MKERIEKILKKELELEHDPVVIGFYERKLSLLHEVNAGGKKFFLKIKKHREAVENFDDIISDEELKRGARQEWEALNFFYDISRGEDCPVNFIKPVVYIEEINGIVTEKAEGRDFWEMVKRGEGGDVVCKVGEGLAHLHEKASKGEGSFEINILSMENDNLDKRIEEFAEKHKDRTVPVVVSMPGFDVRDVLVGADGDVYFMDPGALKEEPAYRAVARFLVTMKVVHQGSVFFPFKCVSAEYEEEFLRGYFGGKEYEKELLNLFILEILMRRYFGANRNFRNTKLYKIPILGELARRFYVDKFYYKEMRDVLSNK